MAKKGNRVQVILECTEHKESGMPGTSRYITTKNKKNTPDRMLNNNATALKIYENGKEISSNVTNRFKKIDKSNQDGKVTKEWCLHIC